MDRYNLIVLGAGSGGLTVAAGAASLGAKVALLERARMGGDCLNYGCVPSKALIKVARVAHAVRTAADHGLTGVGPLPAQNIRTVMDHVRATQARIAPHDSVERFRALGVDVFEEGGTLRSPHEVELLTTGRRLWGRHLVLATGSRPRVPSMAGLEEVGHLTNETVFECEVLPDALLVVGGGPVGAELGQAFARLGSRVTIVSSSEHILPREDPDVAGVLASRLRREGVTVWDRARAIAAERRDGRKQVTIATPQGARTVVVDEILVATGRRPNTEDLGLERVGVGVKERGVKIDRACRTDVPSIWAVGDVAGPYQFTHWANYQARIVIRNTLFPGSWSCDVDTVPWTTFTEPEVARVGLSETDARVRDAAHDVFRAPFADNDRAICDGDEEGFAKIITVKGGGKILGAAIVHAEAGEMLPELTLAMKGGLDLQTLSGTIHVYPTLSEVNRAMADDRLRGRLTAWRKGVLSGVFRWLRG
jgi:pyruvate/2-oxoglutarate dehydrogenase complex dihydrolipoamide dehydrogenase (E3) component